MTLEAGVTRDGYEEAAASYSSPDGLWWEQPSKQGTLRHQGLGGKAPQHRARYPHLPADTGSSAGAVLWPCDDGGSPRTWRSAGSQLPADNLHDATGQHQARAWAGKHGARGQTRVRPPAGSLAPVSGTRTVRKVLSKPCRSRPLRHGSSPRTWQRRPETRQGQTSPREGTRSQEMVGPPASWSHGVPTPGCLC